MHASSLYLVKVDAVAGQGCRYRPGQAMRLLVICKARSREDAPAAALVPLSLAGWTCPQMLSARALTQDPTSLNGVAGDAVRHAAANGYAIIAYPS